MISVTKALSHLFDLVSETRVETVTLTHAANRVLGQSVIAQRSQPPFSASAMDGYAVRSADSCPGATLTVVGESAAGHRWAGTLQQGQAIRISTGAPVPKGADRIIIQEDVTVNNQIITLNDTLDDGPHIRAAGIDFMAGTKVEAPLILTPSYLALLASMNIAQVPVMKRPIVALISTGDELVMPGDNPAPDQIIASNTFGLKALLEAAGAQCHILPIARDCETSLSAVFDLAQGADIIVTIGGASVGDHDLVYKVISEQGLTRQFYKVAMRPGKPLMAGRLGSSVLIGLPGNPVSAVVCGHVFLVPVVRAMLGLGYAPAPQHTARLAATLPDNGSREHYMRAHLENGHITAMTRQDSSLLTVLARSNALLIRPPHDSARNVGDLVKYIEIQSIS